MEQVRQLKNKNLPLQIQADNNQITNFQIQFKTNNHLLDKILFY